MGSHLGDISTEAWSSGMGVGRGANNPTEASKKFRRILRRRPRHKLGCGTKVRRKKKRMYISLSTQSGNFWIHPRTFKVKEKPVSVRNKVPRHEDVMGNGGTAPRILNLGATRKRMINFTSQPLYPQGNRPCSPRIGGWTGLRDGRDAQVKRKESLLCLCRESNPDRPVRSPVITPTELSRFLECSKQNIKSLFHGTMRHIHTAT
jgi:hypothetical protein